MNHQAICGKFYWMTEAVNVKCLEIWNPYSETRNRSTALDEPQWIAYGYMPWCCFLCEFTLNSLLSSVFFYRPLITLSGYVPPAHDALFHSKPHAFFQLHVHSVRLLKATSWGCIPSFCSLTAPNTVSKTRLTTGEMSLQNVGRELNWVLIKTKSKRLFAF